MVARNGAGGTLVTPAPVDNWIKGETWDGPKGKFLNITPEELWRLQKILSNKNNSLSQTKKKKTEANAKVYDLIQKTKEHGKMLEIVLVLEKEKVPHRNQEIVQEGERGS